MLIFLFHDSAEIGLHFLPSVVHGWSLKLAVLNLVISVPPALLYIYPRCHILKRLLMFLEGFSRISTAAFRVTYEH